MIWLTEAEVSERTKIAVSTLQGWRVAPRNPNASKKGPPFVKVGRMIRYPDDQLSVWQRAQVSA
ncbi:MULTISPECIES: helix-turn-helix domain-containing protein [Cryobacterium]|uniref:helix-turn-helix domain-containing protein n=1 Tax=Cryobacterium TaxID=69578 RepID=UPI000CD478A4|nr:MULTISPECIES: helix-turn-helix domain-containing protein [Cryobacterium]POH63608.1 hypothetical protein C3B60_15935 [Cryobacterium zongtaii]TFC44074.1 DNA-binding protein [Cryobacterium sp. TMN-39-2]